MKKTFFILFLLVISISVLLSGCDFIVGERSEGINLVVIASNRANAHAIGEEEIATITEHVARAITRIGSMNGASAEINIRFVRSDGNPQEVHIVDPQGMRVHLDFESTDFQDRDRWIDDFMNTQEGVLAEFLRGDHLNAQIPEVDLMSALRMAAGFFNGMSGTEGNYIFIMDPGISTTGDFNMRLDDIFWDLFLDDETREGMLTADPSRATPIAQRLVAQRRLDPDLLTNVTVVFGNFGNFVSPQAHNIHHDVRERLVDTWTEIIELSGGTISIPIEYRWKQGSAPLHHYPPYILEGTPLDDSIFNPPFVSPVIFPTPALDNRAGVVAPPVRVFNADELGFEPDLATFRNPAEAEITLERIANHILQYLSANPDSQIYIIGSTARLHQGTPNSGTLSQERANVVRGKIVSMLIEAGYGNLEDLITSIGGQCTQFSWRNNGVDEWARGVKDPSDAINSRVVAIFSSASHEYVGELVAAGLLE